ncbi:MAG: aminoacyl-histidine dipeptidase [Turicibacter sp.]|nr:aminoacyl-histidine dipeptidase [Turicibacter sp.]
MEALYFFKEISKIPRASGKEQAISDYLVEFAKARGLKVVQDEALNVVIYKPGTAGYENHPPIALQSHIDMVCEKNVDTDHDFDKDPLKLQEKGEFLYATGTTLGADNGIGVSISMAVLDAKELPHPPLEVIFTSEEETTMKGVSNLDTNLITARRMINMDSGSDKRFTVGCAGGCRFSVTIPIKRHKEHSNEPVAKLLTVRGLLGGHSGLEIALGKANSIRLLALGLHALKEQINVGIITVSGGLKTNAIPREAEALITVPKSELAKAEQIISSVTSTLQKEYRASDPDIQLKLEDAAFSGQEILTDECVKQLMSSMMLLPYGVLHMSHDIQGLVETSNNIGVMTTTDSSIRLDCALRSSVFSRRKLIESQVQYLADAIGVKVEFGDGYPGWAYNPDSPLLAIAKVEFEKLYKMKPEIEAVHAGLECGFMMEKFPDMDIISYCADIRGPHTPEECVSLPSFEKVWDFTKNLLKRL